MSAWLVSKEHIDLLVTAALTWEYAVPEKADEIGRSLWLECLASLQYCYPADVSGDRPGYDDSDEAIGEYEFEPMDGRMDPELVLNAIRSLQYQSCEHPGWKTSEAYDWSAGLVVIADKLVPEFVERFGPIDPSRQQDGVREWYALRDMEGNRSVRGGGWSVDDRDILHRTEKLRAGA